MAIPFIYLLRSLRARFTANIVALLSIAGVVAVFIAMLAMAHGFQKTMVASGSPSNAMILRAGADSEMTSAIELEQAKIIAGLPGVAVDAEGRPLVSFEGVAIVALPLRSSGTDANVQLRGVSADALRVRPEITISEGRFFTPGLNELVVGTQASRLYNGLNLGGKIEFGGTEWTIVGIMNAAGSAFDSEIWSDIRVFNQAYKRPDDIFQSLMVKLISQDVYNEFKDSLSTDKRLTVSAQPEIDYYRKQSETVFTLITVLGFLVASVMGLGAIVGALNTMYSTISARTVEIATLRAIGFRRGNIVVAFMLESLFLAALGGLFGIAVIYPLNGVAASTTNWDTFSYLSFAFTVSPGIILQGFVFALFMGLIGGLFPAIRASRIPITVALRAM